MSAATTDATTEARVGADTLPDVASAGAEALFKEARRRRRRRRVAMAVVILLAAALGAGGLLLAGRGSRGGIPALAHHGARPHSPARSKERSAVPPVTLYPPAQTMGLADAEVGWAATGRNIEITDDGGRTWHAVLPPNLIGMSVSEKVTAVDAIGTDDLWVVIGDVPGLVPYGQSANGSDRGEGIDRSTDGGRTWTFGAVPAGCLQTCGPVSVSFVDPEHGFATTSPQSGNSMLYSSVDGGTMWAPIGTMPNLGSVAVDGPIATPQVEFTSELDGWAVSGPSGDGTQRHPTSPGGVLHRTTDGGRSWSAVPGLPAAQYSLPVFFGPGRGVVLGTPSSNTEKGAAAYVTGDGGATWTEHRIPEFLGAEFKGGSLATRFAAAGPTTWRVDVGALLYETNDGKTWTAVKPTPSMGLGNVASIAFSSPTVGMAIGLPPGCTFVPAEQTTTACSYPVLLVTSDTGRHWAAATF